jgi:hypothetical protein
MTADQIARWVLPWHSIFGNWKCFQMVAVKNSHAFTIVTLRDIQAGESITISYTSQGYYDPAVLCRCASCNPNQPPSVPRRERLVADVSSNKRIHRAGRKHHGRRKKYHLSRETALPGIVKVISNANPFCAQPLAFN